MNPRHLITAIATTVAVLLAIAGCGGPSSSGTSSTPSDPSPAGSTAPSREFMVKGGDNKWATFGEVASDAEREAASKVLEENLRARQAGQWESQCASLTRKEMKEIAPTSGGESLVKACGKALKGMAQPLKATAAVRRDNLGGEIDVLRIKGARGVALFHGSDGNDYAMSMGREDGEWKVAAVLTEEVN